MSGNKLFLDTNIVLYFLRGDQEIVDFISKSEVLISFITELELLSFPDLNPIDEERVKNLIANC